MSRVNLEVVRTKASAIRQQIATIRRYASLPDAEFWADERNIAVLKLGFIQAIHDAADLCNHLSVQLASHAPTSYPDCFEILADGGVIPQALAENLKRMARFHNLLAYHYEEVEDQRVLAYARQELGDLETFLQQVGQAMGTSL